jgi:hypothetical protein
MSETSARNPARTRLIGLAMLAGSGLLGYISVYQVFEKAWAHADKISYGMKAVAITPILGILGLAFLLFPQTEGLLRGEDNKPRPLGWVMIVAALGIGIGFSFWFEQQLSALGYNT